ncbi:hypothetical protein [Kitasatospora sp. NPDC056184]|uniref:hypothetical protein n=1 Tax=Kitasatospora sp. NPDC056184 TaxID=3345738 RepID=UPI0035DF8997
MRGAGGGLAVVPMAPGRGDQVLEVCRAGTDGGDAAFETVAPSWTAFDAARLPEHRFVAVEDDGRVLGRVAASRVSDRPE